MCPSVLTVAIEVRPWEHCMLGGWLANSTMTNQLHRGREANFSPPHIWHYWLVWCSPATEWPTGPDTSTIDHF